jgi:hypothetical protein
MTLRPAVVAISLFLASSCAAPEPGESPNGSDELRREEPTFTLSLLVSPNSPVVGSPINFRIVLRAKQDLVLHFSSGQRYDFEVLDAGGAKVWRWSDGHLFTQVLGEQSLRTGEELTYEESWRPTSAGSYRVRGAITASDPQNLVIESSFEVKS